MDAPGSECQKKVYTLRSAKAKDELLGDFSVSKKGKAPRRPPGKVFLRFWLRSNKWDLTLEEKKNIV